MTYPRQVSVLRHEEYLEKRNLNPDKFYYTERFKKWSNTLTRAFETTEYDDARIVIPLLTQEGDLFGFQGRALGPSKVKYITIMIDETQPKVYGLENVDLTKTVYVVEGPFDSTFVENGIAMCGADVSLASLGIQEVVYVYDNEPRNREICQRIDKMITLGHKVVIFPDKIREKDINDMVMAGHDIMPVLESSTYQSIQAKLKYNEWKRL